MSGMFTLYSGIPLDTSGKNRFDGVGIFQFVLNCTKPSYDHIMPGGAFEDLMQC